VHFVAYRRHYNLIFGGGGGGVSLEVRMSDKGLKGPRFDPGRCQKVNACV